MSYLAALVMGFVGSFHCVAMCGAIALSLRASSTTHIAQRQLVYNLGRIISYVALAAVFSSLHAVAFVNEGQNIVSLVLGSLLFVVSLFLLLDIGPAQQLSNVSVRLFSRFRSVLLRGRDRQSIVGSLLVGIVNGFLPCGFVYLALATALTQSDIWGSMAFMTLFGIGTVPSMLGLVLVSKIPQIRGWFASQRFLSVATALAGLLLVIRGLALGIPYLSPRLPASVQVLSDIKHENVCGQPQHK